LRHTRRLAAIAVFLVVLLSATTALATIYTYCGKGVGSARIGDTYTHAARHISSTYKTVRDTSYSYTVYHTYVGGKMSNGRYPVELYSKSTRRVFRFQINSSRYPTRRGVKIGSSSSFMKSKYPTAKGPYTSGYYRRYTMKHSFYSYATYTDFYCKKNSSGVWTIRYIIVRR